MYHQTTKAREACKKSLAESKEESKAGDLLEYWSERSKEEKLSHQPPKYLKDVCSKLSSPTVSSHAGTRNKFTTNSTPTTSRSRSTTPSRITPDQMVSALDDSVDEDDGSWKSVHSDAPSETLETPTTNTITKRMPHHKYANTPSKLYQPTAASLHGQFKRESGGMSSTTSHTPSTPSSLNEHKDEIPPHINVKYAHVTSKLLAPTAATIAARKVTYPLDILSTLINTPS